VAAGEGALPPGARIGRYRIVGKLGQGGMGVVYRAQDDQLGRVVALKVLSRDLAEDQRFLERFRREGRSAALVNHPNVTRCHEAGEERGKLFLALELVTGGSLADKLDRGPLPWRDAARMGAEIARALEALHGAGIIHRDLKPANVLLDEEGRAKLTDFGLARAANEGGLTRTGELLGTLEYLAPEMAEGGKAVDFRADLYCLGATIYHLLTGHPPFQGQGPVLIVKHLKATPSRPSGEIPAIPKKLDAIVLRLMSKNPAYRGGSAGEVAAALEAVAKMTEEESNAPSRGVLVVAGVLVVLAAAAGLFGIFGPSTRRPQVPVAVPPPPPPAATAVVASAVVGEDGPAWLRAVPARERPPSLPDGLAYGLHDGEYVHARDGSVFVFVHGGEFVMGEDASDEIDERPAHRVRLGSYFIGKFAVSVAQYAEFVRKTGYSYDGTPTMDGVPFPADVSWRTPAGGGVAASPGDPVTCVTWSDAKAYAAWAAVDLPTEAQWERAACWDARTNRRRMYPWGDGPPDTVGFKPASAPMPVDSNPGRASPVGALNMVGNVWEWVLDGYENYPRGSGTIDDATRPDSPDHVSIEHVRRGGTYKEPVRAAYRSHKLLAEATAETGFRVVISLK
jgi:serine/threonine-protein kinase